MFSANENITLRQHKKRVVEYVESTIPSTKLDLGISVMVMQVECRTPGCVPIETNVVIVFPRPPATTSRRSNRNDNKDDDSKKQQQEQEQQEEEEELIPGVKESAIGGSYKTNILLPLASITKDDVLDALPPGFNGGRKTFENISIQCRDFVLGRIGGILGIGTSDMEREERRFMALYLKSCLDDYLNHDCIAPPIGEPFPPLLPVSTKEEEEENKDGKGVVMEEEEEDNNNNNMETIPMVTDLNITSSTTSTTKEKESILVSKDTNTNTNTNSTDTTAIAIATTSVVDVVKGSMKGNGNFVIRRHTDSDSDSDSDNNNNEITKLPTTTTTTTTTGQSSFTKSSSSSSSSSPPSSSSSLQQPQPQSRSQQQQEQKQQTKKKYRSENAMDWRRRQIMEKSIQLPSTSSNTTNTLLSSSSSDIMIQCLASRDHVRGIRSTGCPCCNPDNVSTIVDNMMNL